MIKYQIFKCSCEVKAKHINLFTEGETYFEDTEPQLIETFTNLDLALEDFKNDFYKPQKVYYQGYVYPYYLITEYFLVTSIYNDDEFVETIGFDGWQQHH